MCIVHYIYLLKYYFTYVFDQKTLFTDFKLNYVYKKMLFFPLRQEFRL